MTRRFAGSLVILALIAMVVVGCAKLEPTEDEAAEQTMREIAESHIQGNVPAEKDFSTFLERDLAA